MLWSLLRKLAAILTIAAGTLTVNGKLVVRDPGSDHGNQFTVEDKNGAPMFWINMFGAQSGAEPVCAMNFNLQPVICLGGRYGQYGVTPEIVYYNNGKVTAISHR